MSRVRSIGSRTRWVLAACVLFVGAWPLAQAQVQVAPTPAPGGPDVSVLGPTTVFPARAQVGIPFLVRNAGPGDVSGLVVSFRTELSTGVLPGLAFGSTPLGGLVIVGADGDRTLGTLAANETRTVTLLVATPTQAGGARLFVTISFVDASGVPRTSLREIALVIGPPVASPLQIVYDAVPLEAGATATLRLTARNPTLEPIVDLNMDLEVFETPADGAAPSRAVSSGTALAPLGGNVLLRAALLPAGGELVVETRVVTSQRAPDLVPFAVRAQYAFDGFERAERYEFGARVGGSVRFRVVELREEARDGEGLFITGLLANTGTGTAWSPLVRIADGSEFEATPYALVEDLEPNEPVPFRLPTRAQATNGRDRVVLEVVWNDDFGAVHREQVEATLGGDDLAGGRLEYAPAVGPAFLPAILTGLGLGGGVVLAARRGLLSRLPWERRQDPL